VEHGVTMSGVEERVAPVEEAQQQGDEKHSDGNTDGGADVDRRGRC
jgi:hypothetical protein